MVTVSEMDLRHYAAIRANVSSFLRECGRRYGGPRSLLDVAPQDHGGAAPYFPEARICTLDIDPASKATYIADLCACNEELIPTASFDLLVCTEVLEHTGDPFAAVAEIRRILKPGGIAMISAPFNFRIHGPLPDNWRFTEHGLRQLLRRFAILELRDLPTTERDLMPIHYTVTAQRPLGSGDEP